MNPPLDAPRDVIWSASNHERNFTLGDAWYVKRQLSTQELPVTRKGRPIWPLWDTERLRNEFLATKFVRLHTDIPVPECRLFLQDGLMCFASRRVTNGILLENIPPEIRTAAVAAVEQQMRHFVIPRLQEHRRSHIGSVGSTLPVFPPQRIYQRDGRVWERVCAESAAFSLCHNNLSPQNIWIDPDTFKVVAITGWEFAGFFPPYFELPLWTAFGWVARQAMHRSVLTRDLSFFGLEPRSLRECVPIPNRRRR